MFEGVLERIKGKRDPSSDEGAPGSGPDGYGIPGIDLNEEAQLRLLKELARFYPAPFPETKTDGFRFYYQNIYFSYMDAICTYCMMRHLRPARVVEVGCGYSSAAMLDVNERYLSGSVRFTFIDPNTERLESLLKGDDRAKVEIFRKEVQDADMEIFRHLKANDILFIDSSHISKTGSDVNHIIFNVLPGLEDGVYVHFHDIFSDFEYPKEWVDEGRGYNEAYLLRAFLQYNDSFEIAFSNSFLARKHADLMSQLMPLGMKVPGAGMWIRKRKI